MSKWIVWKQIQREEYLGHEGGSCWWSLAGVGREVIGLGSSVGPRLWTQAKGIGPECGIDYPTEGNQKVAQEGPGLGIGAEVESQIRTWSKWSPLGSVGECAFDLQPWASSCCGLDHCSSGPQAWHSIPAPCGMHSAHPTVESLAVEGDVPTYSLGAGS